MAPVVGSQRSIFGLGVVAGLLATTATVMVPVAVGQGIDAVDTGESVRPWVITLAVLAVCRFVFGFIYRFNLFRAAHRIEADLRNLIYGRLTELSFGYWDRIQSGQVISRANSDIRSIQLLFAFGPLIAMQVVLLIVAIVVMATIDLGLTAVALAPLPMVFFIGLRLRNRIFPLSWVVQARQADVATIVDENIQGTRVVKAFAQEKRQVQLLAEAARRLRWAGTEIADTRAQHAPAMEAFPRLGLALVLLYGGLQAIDGEIGIGALVTFSAFGSVDNGAQCLYGLDYRMAAWRLTELGQDPFHTEVGYWLYDSAARQIMRCFMVPRGTMLIAGGACEPEARSFELTSELGSTTYGILENQYLTQHASTVSYAATITIGDDEWSYEEDSVLKMAGRDELLHHTDRNRLARVADA